MGIEDKPKPEGDFATISVSRGTKARILSDKLDFAKRIGREISYDELVLVMSEITRRMPWISKKMILEDFYRKEGRI